MRVRPARSNKRTGFPGGREVKGLETCFFNELIRWATERLQEIHEAKRETIDLGGKRDGRLLTGGASSYYENNNDVVQKKSEHAVNAKRAHGPACSPVQSGGGGIEKKRAGRQPSS